jgi:hypothetical protein
MTATVIAAPGRVAAAAPEPVHRHAWGRMGFELLDGRPMVRETCATCGTVRRYRAWERYWTPGAGEHRG